LSKQNVFTIVLCAIVSIVGSAIANLFFHHDQQLPNIIRSKRIELVDDQGRIRAVFEVAGRDGSSPYLVMRDADGRDEIEMGVGPKGQGALAFASEHWNQGTVVLGYLNVTDPDAAGRQLQEVDKTGGWGLQVRSPQGPYTGIGFFNSGRSIMPAPPDKK
jgi:hypothetical protein